MSVLTAVIKIAGDDASKVIANQILDLSLNGVPQAPEDTGALRSTGRVESVSGGHAIIYGGLRNVDYASFVHDDLRPRKYKRAGSGPKFVETHILRMAKDAEPEIARILNRAIETVVKTWR